MDVNVILDMLDRDVSMMLSVVRLQILVVDTAHVSQVTPLEAVPVIKGNVASPL